MHCAHVMKGKLSAIIRQRSAATIIAISSCLAALASTSIDTNNTFADSTNSQKDQIFLAFQPLHQVNLPSAVSGPHQITTGEVS